MTVDETADTFAADLAQLNGEMLNEFNCLAFTGCLTKYKIDVYRQTELYFSELTYIPIPISNISDIGRDIDTYGIYRVINAEFDTILEMLKRGDIVATGRKGSPLAAVEIIPSDIWYYANFTIRNNNTVPINGTDTTFYSVRLYSRDNAPQINEVAVPAFANENVEAKNRGGAPRTYRWSEIIDRFMVGLGTPDSQAELVRRVQAAAKASGQEEPDRKTILPEFGRRFPIFMEAVRKRPDE
ncbi:hypothetical protein EZH22_23335 [Xanthobacter dioxanivorans]|uniref:Uncharacterized protein n=1 Tax=Xanthobacter dioxanivorans TaxID=2528964 RepID=A0A974PLR4_9HYPH|nr:hypothetical protein [Xanthobacter dioxanivorans]QRG05922.1 hypothetical protein EZH22_23335 [Xanthobacter dioxanivorans]